MPGGPLTGYDAELRRHDEVLRRALAIGPGEHVLDVGCGTGRTTRDAARAARDGSALGVDVSGPAIARARELAHAEGLGNVAFEQGDAQVHPLPPARFDVVTSRFGTMFFADPVAAFAHVAEALRPAGRLVMLVWQTAGRNEWDAVLRAALDVPGSGAGPASGGPDPFSLGDPAVVRSVLGPAGFVDVTLTDVREPVSYGADVDAALDWVRGFTCTAATLARLDAGAAERAVGRLRVALGAHLAPDGVWLASRAWLVTARRGGGAPGRPAVSA